MVKYFNYHNDQAVKERTIMELLVQFLILSMLITSQLFIKILTTPKMDPDEVPEDASSWFSNVSSPVKMQLSSCLWMAIALEQFGYLEKGKKTSE